MAPEDSLLDTVQCRRLYGDGKTFVDMPPLVGGSELSAAIEALPASCSSLSNGALLSFLEAHYGDAGSDLALHEPEDWVEQPPGFLPGIQNPDVRKWAVEIHGRWRSLCRRTKRQPGAGDDGGEEPQQTASTLLPLPHPFLIPGSRFREMYYWDSLWVVKGLLVSGMAESARNMVANAVSLIERHGFMPNGSRSYYLNRSQPPMLSQMVCALLNSGALVLGDALLTRALAALREEHRFWLTRRHVRIRDPDEGQGHVHEMARYRADWDRPRPESYREDVETASSASAAGRPTTEVYRDIASAAESGWDFSSRWFANGKDLDTICTSSVVPADLNAFLCQMERDISSISGIVGDSTASEEFSARAKSRRDSINRLMWDASAGQWRDLRILRGQMNSNGEGIEGEEPFGFEQSGGVYASNFAPLWCGCAEEDGASSYAAAAVAGLQRSGLLQAGGVAASVVDSGQQWDGSNGWPCLQSMIIEGLERHGGPEGAEMAADIAQRWLRNNYAGWSTSGHMMEKYDVGQRSGQAGGGGEYEVQVGFGWTNGVALELLEKHGLEP